MLSDKGCNDIQHCSTKLLTPTQKLCTKHHPAPSHLYGALLDEEVDVHQAVARWMEKEPKIENLNPIPIQTLLILKPSYS